MRTSAHLVDAALQTTLWSDRYDGGLDDIFVCATKLKTRRAGDNLHSGAAGQALDDLLLHPSEKNCIPRSSDKLSKGSTARSGSRLPEGAATTAGSSPKGANASILSVVGRAISVEDERKLMNAASKSRSPALLPLFVISLDAGLRASEVRSLHLKHLSFRWENGVIVGGELTVPKSKTEADTGRVAPLTSRVCAVLTIWLARHPGYKPQDFLFPRHSIGVAGEPPFGKRSQHQTGSADGLLEKGRAARLQDSLRKCRHREAKDRELQT